MVERYRIWRNSKQGILKRPQGTICKYDLHEEGTTRPIKPIGMDVPPNGGGGLQSVP